MTKPIFRVGYIERPMHQSFIDVMEADPNIDLLRIDLADGDDRVRAALASCHGYYARAARDELPLAWHVTPALLATMPSLLVVASYGAGYDTIDVPACTEAGVIVVNQAGGNAEGVAEHAVGMMLGLLKRMPEAGVAMRAGTVVRREAFLGRELSGRTVGLIGLGHVGTRVAEILRVAFGCRIVVHDPYLDAATCQQRGAEKVAFNELLSISDIVSAHCPLTAETRGLFDAGAFAAMRPGAIFVSTARGSIHDEVALTAALDSGHLSAAGLDVWEREPPPKDHPLLAHPAVLVSPHTAGVTHESRERVARMAAEAFVLAAAGKPPVRMMNPEVTAAFVARRATIGA
ncbi:NAD(P)-dependent oxidoreductase [Humitalea sp. 24SJ18S-53]|uniref:NAD(P)-dependent oxidoreductase n=1 Tax=Humitalea sp. 24SJ18S-53 TaxID=3422307 RepID=UPI003D6775FC